MPVSDMIRLGTVPNLTNQQIADMALEADQQARRLVHSDLPAAIAARKESRALCELLR